MIHFSEPKILGSATLSSMKVIVASLFSSDGTVLATQAFDARSWTKHEVELWAEQEVVEQRAERRRPKSRTPAYFTVTSGVQVAK